MANYPNSLPSFSTYTDSVDIVKAQDISAANREIEMMRAVIGDSPRVISEVSPSKNPTPQTVGDYLDMLAFIVKTRTGAANWYSSNVPLRFALAGSGGGTTVAGSTTSYGGFFNNGIISTEAVARISVPYACTLINIRCQTLSAQPAGGGLTFNWRKNGALAVALAGPAAGGAAATFSATSSVSYAAGDTIDLQIVNASASASAQIGPFSVELDQTG